jgi:hypothetical protein
VASGRADDPKPGKFRDLVAKVEPSVVRVVVPGGLGSGFLIDDKGTIATNYHVIEGAKEAKVVFPDGTSLKVEGYSAISVGKDLALLRVELAGKQVQPLAIAKSRPEKGDEVLAFGAPRGLTGTVTDGIISAVRKGQEVRDMMLETDGIDVYVDLLGFELDMTWLQTTAPISRGNSGGPLVNERGEVVGVNTWVRGGGQNLNFAVSAEHIEALRKTAANKPTGFAELPKPREPRTGGAAADGQRTLEVWNEMWTQIAKVEMPTKKELDAWKYRRTVKAAVAYRTAAAKFRTLAGTLKTVAVHSADDELVASIIDYAQAFDHLGAAIQITMDGFDVKASEKWDAAYVELNEIYESFDFLRAKLSRRYSVDFREGNSIMRDVRAKANADAKAKKRAKFKKVDKDGNSEKAEALASRRLATAKEFIEAKKQAAARQWLERILKEHPDTKAAKEAAEILEELEKP